MAGSGTRLLIIGGGIVGLCTALRARRLGSEVIVLEREAETTATCSFGNAGLVVPSHFVPLAAPGMISKGLRWILNPESPFYVKPRLSWDLLQWGITFWRHANRAHVEASQRLLADLNLQSRELFEELAGSDDFAFQKRGLLMLCQTEKALDEEKQLAANAAELGLQAEVCDSKRLTEIDPEITLSVAGGVWFEQDCHLAPGTLMRALRKRLILEGAEIRFDADVEDFVRRSGRVAAIRLAGGEELPADEFVIAGGCWSDQLCRTLGLKLRLQPGKGYSFTLSNPPQLPRVPSILVEAKVAVTPMQSRLRFAGTMEVGARDLSIDARRVHGIAKSVQAYFPQFGLGEFEGIEPWAGLRPCSPDGLPYVGRAPNHPNVVIATGHTMMGLSLGPITGKQVAEAIVHGSALDPRLAIDRF